MSTQIRNTTNSAGFAKRREEGAPYAVYNKKGKLVKHVRTRLLGRHEAREVARAAWRIMSVRNLHLPRDRSHDVNAILLPLFLEAEKEVLKSDRCLLPIDYQRQTFQSKLAWGRPYKLLVRLLSQGRFVPPKEVPIAQKPEPEVIPAPEAGAPVSPNEPEKKPAPESGKIDMDSIPLEALIAFSITRLVDLLAWNKGAGVPTGAIQVNISADAEKRLKDLEALAIEEISERQKVQQQFAALQTQIQALEGKAYIGDGGTQRQIMRIAYVGPHMVHFRKLQRIAMERGLNVEFVYYDSLKSPRQIFADYALANVDIPHVWSGKVRESINDGKWAFLPSNAERMVDQVKLWLSSK